MTKRIFDIIVSFFGLLLTLPLFIVVSILIKLDSKGSIFFKQNRVGKDGKIFKICKFRTMIKDAEFLGPQLTRKNDARITKIGSILRWFKIDELPQFLNVLKGEMSIVGPRPEVPIIVKLYSSEEKKILSVLPGIVGPNQILGRHELEKYSIQVEDVENYYIKHILPEKLLLDLEYVKEASLKTDIKYFLNGIKATVFGSFKLKYFTTTKIYALIGDILLSGFSYFISYCLRFDMVIPKVELANFIHTLPIILIIRPIVFIYCGLYQSIWKYISIKDFIAIFKAVSISSITIAFLIYFLGLYSHSRSILLIDLIILSALLFIIRIIPRFIYHQKIFKEKDKKRNVLIIGTGDEGEFLLREFMRKPDIFYNPVGFITDDPKKIGMIIHGVKVLGTLHDIPHIVPIKNIEEILIALSKTTGIEIKTIIEFCKKVNVNYRIVPTVKDLLDEKIRIEEIRNVEVLDLLPREPIKLDFSSINKFFDGKRILITGAGGSIGGEIARQIQIEHNAKSLILIDRTENYLYEIEQELQNNSSLCQLFFYLCDITQKEKLKRIFTQYKPHVVFHAAAHKHVPITEKNPLEAIENNVFGTKNIADIAQEFEVEHFVMISTDKAVNPISIMGVSKRIAELYVQGLAKTSKTNYLIVRFGNVLNSKGSVVPLFQKQIEKGGPITITHPEMTRYFMTIQEAVQLVLQSAALGEKGKIFILEMGKPIKIVDMAYEMIKLAGLSSEEIKIKFIGLRPGEKLYEELLEKEEKVLSSQHSKIKIVESSYNNFEKLKKDLIEIYNLSSKMNLQDLKIKLQEIVPTYKPWNN